MRRTSSRSSSAPEGFRRVASTADEIAAYTKKNGHPPRGMWRVECKNCGKRVWGSGLGIGAHRRACPVVINMGGDIVAGGDIWEAAQKAYADRRAASEARVAAQRAAQRDIAERRAELLSQIVEARIAADTANEQARMANARLADLERILKELQS